MMNVPPSEAGGLDLWTYEALLYNWNEAHSAGDDTPDPDIAMDILDRANADPRLVH